MPERNYYHNKRMELEILIAKIESHKKEWIPGTLRISSDHGRIRYYHNRSSGNDSSAYHYISQEETGIARQLAQQEYEKQLLKAAKKLLTNVKARSIQYDDHVLQEIYQNLHEGRKVLVDPIVVNDEEFTRQWLQRHYEPGFFRADFPVIYTEQGERVRSKSEKIIADKYSRLKIPYLYEYPLNLKDGNQVRTIRADFTILNTRTRKEYIHEHFGMIDHPEYAAKFIKKLELYAANHIFPGDNLIMTFESSHQTLSDALLTSLIQQYFI